MTIPCSWDVSCETCPGFGTDGWDDTIRDSALWLASTFLWAATGRRFGTCPITVQPRQDTWNPAIHDGYPEWLSRYAPGGPFLFGGRWFNAGCATACCGQSACGVVLRGPVAAVDEVLVDGEVVSSSDYRVDVANGTYLLVRTDGTCWPACSGPDEPFTVTYRLGQELPEALKVATALLACEYGKFLAGGECRLPGRMTSLARQGIEVQVEPPAPEQGRTGIREVDDVIEALNPSRRQGRWQIMSPDLPENCDRMTVVSAGS